MNRDSEGALHFGDAPPPPSNLIRVLPGRASASIAGNDLTIVARGSFYAADVVATVFDSLSKSAVFSHHRVQLLIRQCSPLAFVVIDKA